MAWEWLAPVGTVVGALAGAAGGVVGVRATTNAAIRNQAAQLEIVKAQVRAENRRVLNAEKRVLYSRFLREVEVVHDAAQGARRVIAGSRDDGDAERAVFVLHAGKELAKLRAEISVIGGPGMAGSASRVISALYEYAMSDHGDDETDEAVSRLMVEMHRDVAPDSLDP